MDHIHRSRPVVAIVAAIAAGKSWWVLLVRRRGQTLFVEINLKAVKPKS